MAKLTLLTCVSLITLIYVETILIVAERPEVNTSYCGPYSNNTSFQSNLDQVLPDLHPKDNGYAFSQYSTMEQSPMNVYAIALCRGDVISSTDCDSCVSNTIMELRKKCPNQEFAFQYTNDTKCMVAYSNQKFSGNDRHLRIWGTKYVTDVKYYDLLVLNLMVNLTDRAAGGGDQRKYAADSVATSMSDYPFVYGTMQCTPDQSEQECVSCLRNITGELPGNATGKVFGGVLLPLCNLWFSTERFYDTLPANTSQSPASRHGKTVLPIVIAVLGVTFVIIVASVGMWWMKKNKKNNDTNKESKSFQSEITEYKFSDVMTATNNFSEENKIGHGAFGTVYRGTLDKQFIAVKRLSNDSIRDDQEFRNKVKLVASLKHKNLVKLLGFSVEGDERLLIYEFFPKESLDEFLSDPTKQACLDWGTSYKIIEGIAQGLVYLHNDSYPRIIHCDLKASNVLLDSNMDPKITDFGMTKLFAHDKIRSNTVPIAETVGYMPPEYVKNQPGEISMKIDVFSFGVLALEIIRGQMCQSIQTRDDFNFLTYAWNCWHERRSSAIIHPRLLKEPNVIPEEISKSINIALLCVQEKDKERPTMKLVVDMLNGVSSISQTPSQPGFYQSQRPARRA